jgi:hypothetical protein
VITVKYDTKKVGIISKSITVTSNASEPTVILKIKGNVLAAPDNTIPEKKLDESGTPVNK